MAIYPSATYRPLERTQRQPKMTRHDIVCLHTMVGNLTGTDGMFHRNGWGGTESHFGIGGKWADGRDGEVIQWQDTTFTADANLDGNHRVLSIETGDNAPRTPAEIPPWTDRQLDSIVKLVAWLCRTYDIPAVLIPDSKPGRRGIGYHRLGCQHSGGTHPPGFLQPGGEHWSSSLGKECPGPARIAQMPHIVSRVASLLHPATVKEATMIDWKDPHKLTDSDVKAYGQPDLKINDVKSYDELIRFPPATARLRRELAERDRDTVAKLNLMHDQLVQLQQTLNAVLLMPPAAP